MCIDCDFKMENVTLRYSNNGHNIRNLNNSANSNKSTRSNGSIYSSLTDEEFRQLLLDYLSPKFYHWIFIVLFFIVFVVGLTGNVMVCYCVWKSNHMKTVTNYFLVNLAVADFLVILLCLPPSVIQDVTQSWFLGSAMCKIFVYLQVSVSHFASKFIGPDNEILVSFFFKLFSYLIIKTCVLGAQKKRLIETVLLSTNNICFG